MLMDKESSEITQDTLDKVAEAVKAAGPVGVKTANTDAAAVKEESEDYYVDPFEQEAKMKEKLAKIEAQKFNKSDDDDEDEKPEGIPEIDDTVRPDMNVSGFFSAGKTAKKESIIKRPASRQTSRNCFLVSAAGAGISLIYLIILFIVNFVAHWFLVAIYIITLIIVAATVFFAIRSHNSQDPTIKRYADLSLVLAAACLIPLLTVLLNNLVHFA